MISDLKLAQRLRYCPPVEILTGELTIPLAEHLRICRDCASERSKLGSVARNSPSLVSSKDVPAEGELWQFRDHVGWYLPKFRYIRPPAVLVTKVSDSAVEVAMTHTFPSFAHLGKEINPCVWAELWNTATIPPYYLAYPLGMTTVVDSVDGTPDIRSQADTLFVGMELEVLTIMTGGTDA